MAQPYHRPRRGQIGLAACAVLAFVSWTGQAQSQGVTPLTPDLVGASRLTITPQATVSYDTNVVHGGAAFARTRNLSLDDVIYGPRIDADVLRPFGNFSAFVRGTVGYNFYGRDTVFNSQDTNISGGLNYFLGPCRVTAGGNYSQQRNDLEGLDPNGVLTLVNNNQTLDGASIDLGCQRTIGFSPTVTVTETQSRNSTAFRQYIDYDSISTRAGIVYQRPTLGSLSVFGEYDTLSYPHRFVDLLTNTGPTDGYHNYSGGLQYTRPIGSRIQATAQVMYTALDEKSPLAPNFSGISYSGNLVAQVTGRLSISADVSLSTVPSNQIGSSYSRDQNYDVGASYALTPRLKLGIGGQYVEQNYKGFSTSLLTGLPLANLADRRSESVNGSATYDLGRRVSLTLDVRELKQQANLSQLGYSDTRVSLTAAAHF